MNKYEQQLEKAITDFENYHPYPQHNIDWICNRISWCWKWRKISREKMEDFSDRICKIMEDDMRG